MAEVIYLNGSLMPSSEASISVSDHGFLYGYGLFETMRAYAGKIFLLERHIKRLMDSAEIIGLSSGLAGIDLRKACQDTLAANGIEDARIRLTVTNGESDGFPWTASDHRPTVVITARPYTPLPTEKYEQGIKIGVSAQRRCNQSVTSGIKSTNYLPNVLARTEAAAYGLDEALLLNDDGFIAEGGCSNAFFVKSSRLVTPSLGSGVLPGITRELVIELAEMLGIGVTEGTVGLGTLKNCDESFLTNSTMEIMPVVAVRDGAGNVTNIGTGKPGDITRKLMAAYKERVKKETMT